MFKLLNILFMRSARRYFCKDELKKKKCDELHKKCCMYKHICKL